MNARTLNTTLIAALLAASGTAQAGHGRGDGDGFTTRAKVLASTPVYETINEPRRECWTETVGYETRSYRDGNNTGGAILGAIAGGLIGSTVGKGDGKVAAAAVGAATGAVVGDRWNSGGTRYESVPQQVERCQHPRQLPPGDQRLRRALPLPGPRIQHPPALRPGQVADPEREFFRGRGPARRALEQQPQRLERLSSPERNHFELERRSTMLRKLLIATTLLTASGAALAHGSYGYGGVASFEPLSVSFGTGYHDGFRVLYESGGAPLLEALRLRAGPGHRGSAAALSGLYPCHPAMPTGMATVRATATAGKATTTGDHRDDRRHDRHDRD